MARGIGVPKYCECSAFTREGVKNVFEEAMRIVGWCLLQRALVHDSREWADFPWTSKSSSVKSQESDMHHRLKPRSIDAARPALGLWTFLSHTLIDRIP